MYSDCIHFIVVEAAGGESTSYNNFAY